jgi:hypothetical protein
VSPAARQGELFSGGDAGTGPAAGPVPPPLLRRQLLEWQRRLAAHQGPLFAAAAADGADAADPAPRQVGLFAGETNDPGPPDPDRRAARLDPLSLQPQSLSFWRWPAAPQQGAALYLVIDRPPEPSPPLLLYVGETARADRRWKGDHDCKGYLAAYTEALRRAKLRPRLSIRFWSDVPAATRPRRALEAAMIRRWQPPFNKETRGRWATPFTSDPV